MALSEFDKCMFPCNAYPNQNTEHFHYAYNALSLMLSRIFQWQATTDNFSYDRLMFMFCDFPKELSIPKESSLITLVSMT